MATTPPPPPTRQSARLTRRKPCKPCDVLRELIAEAKATGQFNEATKAELWEWASAQQPEPARTKPDPATLLGRTNDAANPDTPADRLQELANDPLRSVRLLVAANPSTPPPALDHLTQDTDPQISTTAQTTSTDNPHTPDP